MSYKNGFVITSIVIIRLRIYESHIFELWIKT